MFKKLFTKESEKQQPQQDAPRAEPPRATTMIDEGGTVGGAVENPTAPVDMGRAFWRGLNMKSQSFRRLRDIYSTLPEHFANRIREIDYTIGTALAETHKITILVLSEVFRQNLENAIMLQESNEWQTWYAKFERSCLEFRKNTKNMIHELLSQLNYKDKDVNRLNSIVDAKPGEIEQLTGLDKIEDLKSNLIDIAVLLGKESESKITQNITDEPVRVVLNFIRT